MLKRCFVSMIIVGFMCSAAFAADELSLEKEQIGKLHIGLSETEVRQIIPGKPTRGAEKWWGADGQYHQEWQYPDGGITLGMVSKKKGALKSIESLDDNQPQHPANPTGYSDWEYRGGGCQSLWALPECRGKQARRTLCGGLNLRGSNVRFSAGKGEPHIHWSSRRMSRVLPVALAIDNFQQVQVWASYPGRTAPCPLPPAPGCGLGPWPGTWRRRRPGARLGRWRRGPETWPLPKTP